MEHGINTYTCERCSGHIVTSNPRGLVTPAFLRCRATPGCNGTMHSRWYRVPQDLVAGWEWYQPPLKGLSREMQDHVKNGGGVLRPVPAAPPTDAGGSGGGA